MTWRIAWHPQAVRDLRRLSEENRSRIAAAVHRLAEQEQGDVIRLQGIDPPRHRLRVGELRVLLEFAPATRTLTILRVLPRGRAYRD